MADKQKYKAECPPLHIQACPRVHRIFSIVTFKINAKNNWIVYQIDKTMADKLMFIPIDDTQNYPFCSVKLVVETF